MFDSIRSHRRWLMLFMLVLIFPSFVFFGIQGYNSYGRTKRCARHGRRRAHHAAGISTLHCATAPSALRQSLGANFDPKLLDTPEARAAMLDRLVLDRALPTEATQSNLVVTEDRLREFIARFRRSSRTASSATTATRPFWRRAGQSEAAFEQTLRNDLRKQTLVQARCRLGTIVQSRCIERIERILLRAARGSASCAFRPSSLRQGDRHRCADRRVLPGKPGAIRDARKHAGRISGAVAGNDRRRRSPSPRRASRITTTRTRPATAPRNSGVRATS